MHTTRRVRSRSLLSHSACSESVGGPSGAARGRQPQFRRAHDGGRKSLRRRRRRAGGRSDRSTTSRRPQKAAQRHVSPSVDHSSALWAVHCIPVTTSGELILLPVWDRHPKLNVAQRPCTGYSDSTFRRRFYELSRLFALFESKMAAKTTSGSGFDPKFLLSAPDFLLESGFVAACCQVLTDFTL